MELKYTNHFLNKLEDLFAETDYKLRYERGNFKSGYCLINESKVAVINKFYSLNGKINCLIDILREIEVDINKLSPKNQKFYSDLSQSVKN